MQASSQDPLYSAASQPAWQLAKGLTRGEEALNHPPREHASVGVTQRTLGGEGN